MGRYVIKTLLLGKPDVVFYFKGTDNKKVVSYAMNTIVGFDVSEAKVFHNKDEAIQLCNKLNRDKVILLTSGFEAFVLQSL